MGRRVIDVHFHASAPREVVLRGVQGQKHVVLEWNHVTAEALVAVVARFGRGNDRFRHAGLNERRRGFDCLRGLWSTG